MRDSRFTPRLGRVIAASAALAALATGCTGDDGDGSQDDSPTPSESPTIAEATAPAELAIEPPAGYLALDAAREVPVTAEFNDYVFALDGGSETSKILVSAYLLDEPIEDDYSAWVEFARTYFSDTGYEVETMNDRRTMVHRRNGVIMFTELTDSDGNPLTQQNHFLFHGNQLILVTCQWHDDFEASFEGCMSITQDFPFPDSWA